LKGGRHPGRRSVHNHFCDEGNQSAAAHAAADYTVSRRPSTFTPFVRMLPLAMPDDDKDKHDPIEDVRKGLGLLFRAAKGAVEKIPTKDLEQVVVTSAREVGRALENVAKSVEREVIRVKDDLKPQHHDKAAAPPAADAEEPKSAGPRVEDEKSEPPKPPAS
jgi:hypothetical protein